MLLAITSVTVFAAGGISAVAQDNTSPEAGDDSATTQRDLTAVVNVLDNDRDADGHDLRVIRIVEQADDGEATINEDYTISYDPDRHFTGQDAFFYEVIDDHGGEDIARVDVTVRDGEQPAPRRSLPLVRRPGDGWFKLDSLPEKFDSGAGGS